MARSGAPPQWTMMLLALLLLLAGLPSSVTARVPIRVLVNSQDYVYSETLRFELQVESDNPLAEVILFYGMVDSPLVRRIYPAFEPSTSAKVTHVEELESGQFAPGTMMRSWWHLRTQDGNALTTEHQRFEYTDRNQQWRTLQGQGVDLLWYGRDEDHARSLLQTAEKVLDRLQEDMGVPASSPVRIYVYNSQTDMRPSLSLRSQGYDDRVMTLGVAMGEDVLILLGTHRDVHQTIAHELSHIVVGIATDNPYTDLPRWLDEGLAMYAQGELPADNERALYRAINEGTLLSIRSMTSYSGRASEVDQFYGAAYSIVDFMLQEFNRDKMQQLLAVFAEGARQEEALQRVYGFGLDELDTRWRASLGLKPRSRSTPSPAARDSSAQHGIGLVSLSLSPRESIAVAYAPRTLSQVRACPSCPR